ncbi:MAG: ABC transporter permease [Lewinellaceae bacterium]|nr:ABC transporter permease [Lewinella sp.]MCB9280405.1 ABC transporter permease [Lewinellaceae bacterium]
MFNNYLKIALRSLWRHKGFSTINIFGLTVGTACCLYILMHVLEQFSYDRHHPDVGSIYRVATDIRNADGTGNEFQTARLSPPIAPAMALEFPEVEIATRVVDPPDVSHHVFTWQNHSFFETKGYYVDSTFFRIFDYKWVYGAPEHALDEPYSVVITPPISEKLFGRQDPVGQTIRINNRFGDHEFKVTGVVDPKAKKSHIRANFYMTMNSGGIGEYVRESNHWAGNNFISGYVKLKPHADAEALEAKLPAFLNRHGTDQLRELGMAKSLELEPVRDIHLYSTRQNQLDTTVSARFLYILLMIAGFIQLIACINFMNLTTARAANRAREVGIRKTVGAGKMALIRQFLGESLLLSVVAILIAVPLVKWSLPFINNITGEEVSGNMAAHPGIWLGILGLSLLTGVLSGSYPAFYLSGFRVVNVLKGNFRHSASAAGLRKGLVVFQFVISVGLVIGALVISRQLNYMVHADLGFDQQQKIIVPFRTDDSRAEIAPFKSEISARGDVESVSSARVYPGQFVTQDFGLYKDGQDMNSRMVAQLVQADENYLSTLEIPLLDGRNFVTSDTNNQLIVNEEFLRRIDIPLESAVGTRLFSDWENEHYTYQIIGVMKNYHFRSMREEMSPLMLEYTLDRSHFYTIVAAKTNDYNQLLSDMEQLWGRLNPGLPFEYVFLDEDLQKQYNAERSLSATIQSFTLMAILIACLGLLGLSAFMVEQRVKEIGIRKVLGASATGIAGLLSRDFLRLILVAIVLAIPLAWWAMNKWLQDFANRVAVEWWVFALAGGAALLIAGFTVGFQAIRAAWANPVKSLRSE